MAFETNRRTFSDGEGGNLIMINKVHGDDDGNPINGYEIRHNGRTLKSDVPTEAAAVALIEAMGGIELIAGDARAMAAEIGGTSVLQAAMAPLVTALAEEHEDQSEVMNDARNLDRNDDSEDAHKLRAEIEEVETLVTEGGRVPDSQSTGVMEITTGLGGVRRHGLGERFEGALEGAEERVELRTKANEQALKAAAPKPKRKRPSRAKAKSDPQDTTKAREASRSNEGQEPATGGTVRRNDTPQTASGSNTPASASSPSPSGAPGY